MNEPVFLVEPKVIQNIEAKIEFANLIKEIYFEPRFAGDKRCANRENFFHNQIEYFYIMPRGVVAGDELDWYQSKIVPDVDAEDSVVQVYPVNRSNILRSQV